LSCECRLKYKQACAHVVPKSLIVRSSETKAHRPEYCTHVAHMVKPMNNGPIVSAASCAGFFVRKVSSASESGVEGILANRQWKGIFKPEQRLALITLSNAHYYYCGRIHCQCLRSLFYYHTRAYMQLVEFGWNLDMETSQDKITNNSCYSYLNLDVVDEAADDFKLRPSPARCRRRKGSFCRVVLIIDIFGNGQGFFSAKKSNRKTRFLTVQYINIRIRSHKPSRLVAAYSLSYYVNRVT
jgi:hypothetical protein